MRGLRDEITRTFLRSSRKAVTRSDPAFSVEETEFASDERVGMQFGIYKIIRKLGSGGMALVYLARDTRLDRQVALKFVPPEFVHDEEMLQRLEQEAKTASGLNHPNILTIYDICKEGTEAFIVSEFVEGVTLREALQKQPLTLPQALDVAAQVASALVAAHSRNIIHRDLKPGNIMVRPDGYVKVIDFGLAKNVATSSDGATRMALTRQGAVLGTVAYMSPEQARGAELDHRTDLWSLGVVLYEIVSTRKPFNGETESHLIVEILDKPIPSLTGRTVPPALWNIIHKALAKDRNKRYQSAAEMHADLTKLSRGSDALTIWRSTRTGMPAGWRSPGRLAAMGALLLLACLTAAFFSGQFTRFMPVDWFRVESVDQLTTNGRIKLACISPDGKYVAFVVGDSASNSPESVAVKQIGSLSQEEKIPPRRINYRGITFSPEGHAIYVVGKDEKLMGRLYTVPLIGEVSSRPVLEDIDGPIAFSGSGDRFAFVRYAPHDSTTQVEVARAGREPDDLISSSTVYKFQNTLIRPWLAWSPTEDRIAGFSIPSQSRTASASQAQLHLIGLDHSGKTISIPGWASTGRLWWTPGGRTVLVTASTGRQSDNQAQIKEIAVANGEVHDVLKDPSGYRSISLTHDGKAMAAIKVDMRTRLWVSTDNQYAAGRSVLSEAESFSSLAWADDQHTVISAPRGPYLNLSSFDVDTSLRSTLTNDSFEEEHAAAVPRSRTVVFSSTRGGGSHIWKYNPESNTYSQLTSGTDYDEQPAVSPDGTFVVYTSWVVNTSHLYRVSINGGERSRVSDLAAAEPAISPDGRWVACRATNPLTSEWSTAILAIDGQSAPRYLSGIGSPFTWSPDGTSLTSVLTDGSGTSNLWVTPITGPGTPRKLTNFDDEKIMRFAWSPSGRRLACVRGLQGTDVVLIRRQN